MFRKVSLAIIGAASLTVPLLAHHAFSAEFDAKAPVTLNGPVTKVEWINPHTWIHVEVTKDGKKLETPQRFKGLGEMDAEQLWETTLNPDTRRLSLVGLGEVDAMDTTKRFHLLMGRTEASSRRAWLEEKGHEAEADL